MTGNTAKETVACIQAANEGKHTLQSVDVENAECERERVAEGYEFERTIQAEVDGQVREWAERVLVVRSESYRQAQREGLEARLKQAEAQLNALTPPRARGKRQIQDEAELVEAAMAILKQHSPEGLLTYTFERQEQSGHTVYLCVGRAGRVPRLYRGKDIFEWLVSSGFLDRTPGTLPSPRARFAANPHLSGKAGGHSLNLHQFARDGVTLLGHIRGVEDGRLCAWRQTCTRAWPPAIGSRPSSSR